MERSFIEVIGLRGRKLMAAWRRLYYRDFSERLLVLTKPFRKIADIFYRQGQAGQLTGNKDRAVVLQQPECDRVAISAVTQTKRFNHTT